VGILIWIAWHLSHHTLSGRKLDGADRIFTAIKPKIKDVKLGNFVTEIQAYLAMLRDDDLAAKSMYEALYASEQGTYMISHNRSKAMLAVLK
jgi:hypothetical protein